MQQRTLGSIGDVSVLSLGGGGIGQVWGATTHGECIAIVRAAAAQGITLFDLAPSYGNGLAEEIIGEAFAGQLPPGCRVSTKCLVGNPPAHEVALQPERSLDDSLHRMRLDHADLFILHGQVGPDAASDTRRTTPLSLFRDAVRPAFDDLVRHGRIGAWGITGIGWPSTVLEIVAGTPPPAVIQCITNLLDSPGSMQSFAEPARPREIISASSNRGVGVMGIRAVQAGALTDQIDRHLPEDSLELRDYRRAAGFRLLAHELGESAAALAHRYALTIPGVATVVLGVKNRQELEECLAAADRGPLPADLMDRIDAAAADQEAHVPQSESDQ